LLVLASNRYHRVWQGTRGVALECEHGGKRRENTLELTVEMAHHPKEVKDQSYDGSAVSDSEHSTVVCSCGSQDVCSICDEDDDEDGGDENKEEQEDGDINQSGNEETMNVGGNRPINEAQIIPLVEASGAESLGGKIPTNFLNSKANETRAEPSGKALAMQEKDAATTGEAIVHAGSRLTGSVEEMVLSHVKHHATDGNNNVDSEGKK
jgi:hypothetical protein